MSFSIRNTTRTPTLNLPYEQIIRDVLGAHYELSLVFVGDKRSATLNKTYRGKTYIPNVLSFPLASDTGEIYINPHRAHKEAHKYGMTYEGFIGYLFIHAVLHLKGYDHGATMESAESRFCKKYRFS